MGRGFLGLSRFSSTRRALVSFTSSTRPIHRNASACPVAERQLPVRLLVGLIASAGLILTLVSGGSARAATIDTYQPTRSFNLPASNNSFGGTVLFDALSDGRLLVLNESELLAESSVRSGSFTSLGNVANFAPPYGPAFLKVSPDGTMAAAGSNGAGYVSVFPVGNPGSAVRYNLGDYDAAWIDNTRLAVANSGQVQVLNTSTGTVKTIINNVGGASGGIAFDHAGNLFTGNSYSYGTGTSDTGWVKAFTASAWQAALASGTAIDFEASGRPVVDLLSAASIGFDASGNFFIAGGDAFGTSGDVGYAGLVDAEAIRAALNGTSAQPPIDMSSPSDQLRKFATPQPFIDNFQTPFWTYNSVTGELYLRYFGDQQVTSYSVPEPTATALLGLAGCGMLLRRRSRAARRPAPRWLVTAAVGAAGLTATTQVEAAYVYDPDDFATKVISAQSNGPYGSAPYDDPASLLGRPTLRFNNGTSTAPDIQRVKLFEPAVMTGPSGERLVTTLNTGSQITLRMGRTVTNDPSHPFGIDLIVFGNAFYSSGDGTLLDDTTNLNRLTVGPLFSERVKVSVSPDGKQWYRFDDGPYADGAFPTNSYLWDESAGAWTDSEADPTKAVDPALASQVSGKTAADVLRNIYRGAAGGTGYDLSLTPFDTIDFVRVEGLSGFAGGEVDAIAAVPEPASLAFVGGLFSLLVRRRRARG